MRLEKTNIFCLHEGASPGCDHVPISGRHLHNDSTFKRPKVRPSMLCNDFCHTVASELFNEHIGVDKSKIEQTCEGCPYAALPRAA